MAMERATRSKAESGTRGLWLHYMYQLIAQECAVSTFPVHETSALGLCQAQRPKRFAVWSCLVSFKFNVENLSGTQRTTVGPGHGNEIPRYRGIQKGHLKKESPGAN